MLSEKIPCFWNYQKKPIDNHSKNRIKQKEGKKYEKNIQSSYIRKKKDMRQTKQFKVKSAF